MTPFYYIATGHIGVRIPRNINSIPHCHSPICFDIVYDKDDTKIHQRLDTYLKSKLEERLSATAQRFYKLQSFLRTRSALLVL